MANQGCVNEGTDTRLLGWLVCPLQRLLSWKSERPPKLLFGKLPRWGVFWPPYVVSQRRMFGGKYKLFRLGWRYDNNWRGYIFPTGAYKPVEKPMEKGY